MTARRSRPERVNGGKYLVCCGGVLLTGASFWIYCAYLLLKLLRALI